jgi:hypothetical protein
MGMYDHVKVEHESMSAEWRTHIFQTKDLDNSLCLFTITADGRLLRRGGWGKSDKETNAEYQLHEVEEEIEFYDWADPRASAGIGSSSAPLMHFFARFRGSRLAGPIEGPFPDGNREARV